MYPILFSWIYLSGHCELFDNRKTGKIMISDVVLIDDEEALIELVRVNLMLRGYKIDCASSGEDGIEMVRKKHPSLVLLDIRLPDMDGWQVCRILKNGFDGWKPSVVFLSAATQAQDQEKAREAGGDGFLIKPFEIQELISTVQKFRSNVNI